MDQVKGYAFEPLIGQFVRLEPLNESHAAGLYAIGPDENMWAYMPRDPPRSLDDAKELVREALRLRDSGAQFPFAQIDARSGEVIGSTRFIDIQPYNRGIEIGWTFLRPASWRSAINTEAKLLMMRYAFERLGVARLCLKTDGRNVRAQTAIERLGAKKEGVLRRHTKVRNDFIRDTVMYSILPEEWPEVKARLEASMERRG